MGVNLINNMCVYNSTWGDKSEWDIGGRNLGSGSGVLGIQGQRGGLRMVTHKSWDGAENLSKLITMKTVENSRIFIMDDQPEKLDEVIYEFLGVNKRGEK